MIRLRTQIFLLFCCVASVFVHAENPLSTKGQASVWTNTPFYPDLALWSGIRYIPTLHFATPLVSTNGKFDAEVSVNALATLHTTDGTVWQSDASLKPYRLWGRYTTNQLELRLGLQKLNFGSATILRPLMWFDKVDPRDPLQLTDGVWGLLGRYYFLDNSNIWLWVLHGNKTAKMWEIGDTYTHRPEVGGRYQRKVGNGEMGASYHHRIANTSMLGDVVQYHGLVPENRIGLDGKWDAGCGIWFETSYIQKNRNIGLLTHQTYVTVGADYTFAVGNGLACSLEQLLLSHSEKWEDFTTLDSFSALTASYPIGLSTTLGGICYYHFSQHTLYSMATVTHQWGNFSLHGMLYHNPSQYQMPFGAAASNQFVGSGIQLMLVYTH